MIAPHQVPARQASAATRQMQPAPAAPAAQVAQPQPAAAQPAQPPHPTAGGPVAVLHDGAKLHFPPGTPPEGMDAGVQHHLAGRAQGAQDAQTSIQALTLAELQKHTALMAQLLRAIQVMGGTTSQAIGQSAIAIIGAIKGQAQAPAQPVQPAPTVAQPAAWSTGQ